MSNSKNNSRSSNSRKSFEKLLAPSQAKAEITKLVDDAIELAAQKILELKKKKKNRRQENCSTNCCFVDQSSSRLDTRDAPIDADKQVAAVKSSTSTKRKEKKKKKAKRKQKIVTHSKQEAPQTPSDNINSSGATPDPEPAPVNDNMNSKSKKKKQKKCKTPTNTECSGTCDCGAKTLPLPVSHGVFPEEPLFFRDRYFECSGTAMYTREIFLANGKKLKIDRQKLATLRGLPVPIPTNSPPKPSEPGIIINEFTGYHTNAKAITNGSSKQEEKRGQEKEKEQQLVVADNDADSRTRTIVVKDITKNAKGMSLTLKIKVVKKSGEEKEVEFSVDLPDFEPKCLRYGNKVAFLD